MKPRLKKIIIIPIVLLIAIALFSSPFYLNQETKDSLDYSFKILSSLASVASFVFIWYAYKKFNISNSILLDQHKKIIELREEIDKFCLTIYIKGPNNLTHYYEPKTRVHNFTGRDFNNELVFSVEEYSKKIFPVFRFGGEHLLPLSIKRKVLKFGYNVSQVSNEESEKGIAYVEGKINSTGKGKYSIIYGQPLSLKDYLNMWKELLDEIDSWQKKYAPVLFDT
jgi:hypothetical protein